MTVMVEVDGVGQLLRIWRIQSGITLREIANMASEILPGDDSITHTTVGNYEDEKWGKGGPNPLYLTAITRALGHKTTELPDPYDSAIEQSMTLLTRSRWSSPRGQASRRVGNTRPRTAA